jgi:uncharacterized protein
LLWQGPPRRLLDLARQRTVPLCTSPTLLAELAEVIGRDKFVQRVRAATLSATELVQDYERLAEVVEPQPLPAPTSRDSDDDHVLACALAGKADLIVSGDRDLLTCTSIRASRFSPPAMPSRGSPRGAVKEVRYRVWSKTAAARLSCLASTSASPARALALHRKMRRVATGPLEPSATLTGCSR